MTGVRAAVLAVAILASEATIGWLRWDRASFTVDTPKSVIAPLVASRLNERGDSNAIVTAARLAVAHDVFRLANHPAAVRYSMVDRAAARPGSAPRPTLTLMAIVGGAPWQAVVSGLAGRGVATVVRTGMIVDHFTVVAIGRDAVVIRGPDSTWRLTLSRPGP